MCLLHMNYWIGGVSIQSDIVQVSEWYLCSLDVRHSKTVIWSTWSDVFLLKAQSNFFTLENILQITSEKGVIVLKTAKD